MRSAHLAGLTALLVGAASPARAVALPFAGAIQQAVAFAPADPQSSGRLATTPVVTPEPAGPSLDFWRRLGDPTLDRLLAEALRANLDVRAAEARVRSVRAARSRATLDLLPEGVASGGYTRRRLATSTFPGATGTLPGEDIWDAGLDAAWEVDVFGRLRSNVRGQGALVAASESDLDAVQVSLAAELARAYFEFRGAQEQLGVARQNAANQQRTLELTRERLEAGRGTAFDTERATAQLGVTRASIPLREAQVAQASYRIGVLLAKPPASVAADLGTATGHPVLPDTIIVEDQEAIARRRPDVTRAERFAQAQSAFVSAAKAEYLPRLSIGGSLGYLAPEASAFGNTGTFRYAVGPVLTWPVLNLGRVRAGVQQARAEEDAARAEHGQAVLAAMEEVESALARYRAARARAVELEGASAASERAAELARMRFGEGITDFLQVLDAERTQLESQELLAQSRTEAATAYAALYKALGGR